jgi:hypothetical protein
MGTSPGKKPVDAGLEAATVLEPNRCEPELRNDPAERSEYNAESASIVVVAVRGRLI